MELQITIKSDTWTEADIQSTVDWLVNDVLDLETYKVEFSVVYPFTLEPANIGTILRMKS